MIDTIASVATAVGIAFAALGIWLTRRQMTYQFEQTFSERYRTLSDRMPIEFLRGRNDFEVDDETERSFRLYLELCEDQLYYRRHGRISSNTWIDWWIGMSAYARRPALKSIVDATPGCYTLLRAALTATSLHDPAASRARAWRGRRAWARRRDYRRDHE